MATIVEKQRAGDVVASGAALCGASHASAAPRAQLEAIGADFLRHSLAETVHLAPAVMRVDAEEYTDPVRFDTERRRIFRRLPLMLAAGCELAAPGDYKTMDVAGVPVLIVRGKDGVVRAFLNSCTHRGSSVASGCGSARRFTCPYHGWTFGQDGALLAVASSADFGTVDKAALGLRAFPTRERAGLIWVVLDPDSMLYFDDFFSGFDRLLEQFGFESWTFVESRTLRGANWKLAFDAHLEFYHLPVLHRETFGPERSNRTLCYAWGPHQRLIAPKQRPGVPEDADIFTFRDRPAGEWPVETMMLGEWIIFPCISINSFYNGGRGVFISQVFPGEHAGESFTIQFHLAKEEPDEAARAEIRKLCDFLAHVVGEEDLPTSFHQQKALDSGVMRHVHFGRNEGGLQHFHRWVDAVTAASDAELPGLFRGAVGGG